MIKENINENHEIEFIPYDRAFEMVKEDIGRALSSAPVIIRKYTEHLQSSSGKLIRAVSLLTCAQNKEDLIHTNAVKFAAAIEIMHLATLVHDDVIDNAGLRRGKITLQKKFGKRTAVICGDYLFCIAMKIISSVPNREDYVKLNLPDYMGRVCLGELNQHIHNGFLDLSVYRYLKIISGKTAALFEASFCAGAVVGGITGNDGRDDRTVGEYMKLGRYIGMIFQMQDDCMDFEKTEDIAKKPVQSDFEQGVITLPLIYAFKNLRGLREKAEKTGLSRTEINEAVAKTGGINYTRLIAGKYYGKASKIIELLDITGEKRDRLFAVLNKAYGRV